MKGRFCSFQRVGRVFGLTDSVCNKYPQTTDKRKQIYDETKDEYKYFEELNDDYKEKGKYDAHDNYGCLTEGVCIWKSEEERKAKEKIGQFNPKNFNPRNWKYNKKTFQDYYPIIQENVPTCVDGNYEEKLPNEDRTELKKLKKGPGFQEVYPNRPIIRITEKTKIYEDTRFCSPIEMPAGVLHEILSKTKEIKIKGDFDFNLTARTADKDKCQPNPDTVKCTFRYQCGLEKKCPLTCKEIGKQDIEYNCCIKADSGLYSLKVESGDILSKEGVILKRFHEYTNISSDTPQKLDLSRNHFAKEIKYVLTKDYDCSLIPDEDGFYPQDPRPFEAMAKLAVNAEPKTRFDAGCVNTPYLYGHHINQWEPSDVLQQKGQNTDCEEGGVYNFDFYSYVSRVPIQSKGHLPQIDSHLNQTVPILSSPYGGGPSLFFRLNEPIIPLAYHVQRNGINRMEYAPIDNKWHTLYQQTEPCDKDHPPTPQDMKIKEGVCAEVDYKKRLLKTTIDGDHRSIVYTVSYCPESKVTCNPGKLDGCTGKYENDCSKSCDGKDPCEKLTKGETYGNREQGSITLLEKRSCPSEKKCCNEGNKIAGPDATEEDKLKEKMFGATMDFQCLLGRFAQIEERDEATKKPPRLMPIPIHDEAKNKDTITSSIFGSLTLEIYDVKAIDFYFTKEAAELHMPADDSLTTYSVEKGGTITFKYEDWSKGVDVYFVKPETDGDAIEYGLTCGDNHVGACTQNPCKYYESGLSVCRSCIGCPDNEYQGECDCASKYENIRCYGTGEYRSYAIYKTEQGELHVGKQGFSGGVSENPCDSGPECTGCSFYDCSPLPFITGCKDYPCCSTQENEPCKKCEKQPECTKPINQGLSLTCPSVLHPKYIYTSSISLEVEFVPFKGEDL